LIRTDRHIPGEKKRTDSTREMHALEKVTAEVHGGKEIVGKQAQRKSAIG
jgi:hypothetical protein